MKQVCLVYLWRVRSLLILEVRPPMIWCSKRKYQTDTCPKHIIRWRLPFPKLFRCERGNQLSCDTSFFLFPIFSSVSRMRAIYMAVLLVDNLTEKQSHQRTDSVRCSQSFFLLPAAWYEIQTTLQNPMIFQIFRYALDISDGRQILKLGLKRISKQSKNKKRLMTNVGKLTLNALSSAHPSERWI